MMILQGIVDGSLALTDVDYAEENVMRLTSADFYPNDQAVIDDPEQGRKFGVSKVF